MEDRSSGSFSSIERGQTVVLHGDTNPLDDSNALVTVQSEVKDGPSVIDASSVRQQSQIIFGHGEETVEVSVQSQTKVDESFREV